MPRTKEQIDKMNVIRKAQGLADLPYEDEQPKSDDKGNSEQEAAAKEEAEAKALAEANAAKEKKDQQGNGGGIPNTEEDETEEQLIAKLNKKAGLNIKSLADLKPQETTESVEAAKKERASKKLSWGLQNNLFTTEDYDAFRRDYDNPESVVYNDFRQEVIAEEPNLTEEEVRERFQEEYHQNQDQDSASYKRGQKAIQQQSERIIREKHAKIFGLDAAYDSHEAKAQTSEAEAKRISDAMPAYRNSVKAAFEANKTIKAEIGGTEIEVPVLPEHITEIENALLAAETAKNNINQKFDQDRINKIVETAIITKGFKAYAQQFAEQYHIAHAAGTKGIPALDRSKPENQGKKVYTPNQIKALKEAGMGHLVDNNAN